MRINNLSGRRPAVEAAMSNEQGEENLFRTSDGHRGFTLALGRRAELSEGVLISP